MLRLSDFAFLLASLIVVLTAESDEEIGSHKRDKRSNIPCGSAFTPCQRRTPGVIEPFVNSESRDAPDPSQFVTAPNIRHQMLGLAIVEAKDDVDRLFNQSEPFIRTANVDQNSKLWSSFRKSSQHAKDLSYSALVSVGASQRLRSFGLRTDEIVYGLPKMDLEGTALQQVCPPNPIEECRPGRFRTYSGHCNNVNHPLWGAAFEPMARYLAPDYSDEVNRPRSSSDGTPLPNPRDVSVAVFKDVETAQKKCSLMVMQWAQFVYEDLVHLGSVKGAGLKPLPCCDINHAECMAVNVSSSDPLYRGLLTCMPYARTSPSPREDCLLGPREQANMVSSFLDGSMIYGSTVQDAKDLRSFQDGKLKTTVVPLVKDLLPQAEYNPEECRSTRNQLCFKAGSAHANLVPTLTSLHTIWMRQHNRLAETFKGLNPLWDDERLYQEARKVVAAQIQHITFGEFLPIIIGADNMQKFDLSLNAGGYYSDYDLKTNPTVLNVYSSAVGLFFYSLLPGELAIYSKNKQKTSQRPVSDYFYDPGALYFQDRVDGFLRFLLNEKLRDFDPYFSAELTSRFLKNGNGDFGLDLPALIVQMGRDHGLPGYSSWRSHCGLRPLKSFDDLNDELREPTLLPVLKQLYRTVEDVDLFVLGLAEKPAPGALVGPTFACILSKQFQKVRRGDRFWYENFFFPSAFEQDQLSEIRKTTLARIICDNADDFGPIQPSAFMFPDNFENFPMECNSTIIHSLNYKPWIDSEPRIGLPITQQTLEKAIKLGRSQAKDIDEKEAKLIEQTNAPGLKPGDPLFAHSQVLSARKEALDQASVSKVLLETTKVLIRGDGLEDEERLPKKLDVAALQRLLPQVDISHIVGNVSGNNERCVPKEFPCDHTYPYRTYSGWCNNLRFPSYGNAFNPFRRLLDPVYDDGFDEPRKKDSTGQPLPSPRVVSNQVHNTEQHLHVKYTHMLMQFGQILDHDMTHSPIHTGPNNQLLNCSSCNSRETVSLNCYPIPVPPNDPHFPATNPDGSPKCLALTRSVLGQLTLGYREQIDQLTSFIDASNVYGSTECQANDLRLFSGGKLNFTEQFDGLREGLPQGFREKDCRSTPKFMCFHAGDGRVNEQTGLTALHTVFMREHNRIATRLGRINNFWTDEKIYQETRKIVGAMMQHMVFNEFLPKVLGMEVMQKYGLILRKEGYSTDYDPYCDATVANSFATAAFRFGHTLIKSEFARMDDFYHNFSEPLKLKQMFMNTTPIYDSTNGGVDTILLGLVGTPAETFDRHITKDVRDHLFEKANDPFSGMDLISLNIQRAREHGIPPYNFFREFCGLQKAKSFEDLADTSSDDAIQALKRAYRNVDDIDLFPGLMTENSVRGGLVGPTTACILGEQMQRLRKCDRFWYENDASEVRFTPDQLIQIRKATLSKIVCSNSQFIRKIQPKIFDMPDELLNNQVPCQDLPEVDLYEWLDRQFCVVDHRVINLGKAKRITPCVSCTCTSEGPECHSIRINDCTKLLEEFIYSEVAEDTVCIIQCSAEIKRKSAGRS